MVKCYTLTVKFFFALFFLQVILTTNVFASLSGNYTINPSAAASASNYKNFASAINDLKLGTRTDGGPMAGPGVGGAVTFTVAAGTYTGQVDIPLITGASSINTITFDGVNASICTILADTTPVPDYAVVKFDTCKFVTVKNFTITTTVPTNVNYSCGVQFMGQRLYPCNNNQLTNCIVNVPIVPYLGNYNNSPYGFATMDGIIFNGGSTTNSDQTGYFNNNIINGCTVNHGYYGIYVTGTTDSCVGNIFSGNTLINYSSAGMFMYDLSAMKIIGNTLSSNNTSYQFSYDYWYTVNTAMYIFSCDTSATDFIDISGNKINSFWETGINVSGLIGGTTKPVRISNNFISNGGQGSIAYDFDCIYLSGCLNYQIWFNSMQMNSPTGAITNSVFYEDGSSLNGDIRNNIFSYAAAGGKGLPFYGGKSSQYTAFDYNIFYNADSAKYGFSNNTLYNTANVGGTNIHSYATNPNFKSGTDFHLKDLYAGKPGIATSVTADIDGETRGTPPLIGADDFPAVSDNDLGVTAIKSPVVPIGSGSQTIATQIVNFGTGTITSATVGYILNGGAAVTQAWSGALAQGDSVNVSFTVMGNLNAGFNSIKIYTSNPNGHADSYTGDDTLATSLYTSLKGVYTINSSPPASGTNFISFNSAASALNGGVVIGAVLINVSPGTYNEQIELDSIIGTSAANTVRFDGIDTSKVTLTWNGSFGLQHTIKLNGCKYVVFSRMKITGTNPTYAWPVHFAVDRTSYDKIVNCAISVPSVMEDLNEVPVVFCGSDVWTPPYFFPPVIAGHDEIDSCVISGGKSNIMAYTGIVLGGEPVIDTINSIDNKFIDNYFTNYLNWGLWLDYGHGAKVLNNVANPNNDMAGGILVSGSRNSIDDFTDVSGNTIRNFGLNASAYGGAINGGLSITTCTGGAKGHFRVSNNMVGGLLASSNCFYMSGCINVDVVFNTFSYDMNASGMPSSGAFYDNSPGPNTIENNIMAITAGSGSPSCFFEATVSSQFTAGNFDYNIFYNAANSNSAYINGTMYTPSNVVGALGYNVHSYIINPSFVSNTNWHIAQQSNLGASFSGITTDFDGQTRAAKPCIGADEINIGCSAPVLPGQISGDTLICQGQKDISYSIPSINGATSYRWTLPGGISIASGSTSNNITVNFSDTALQGNIVVNGVNACGSSSVSLPFVIDVNAAPVVSVASQNTTCNGNCNGQAEVIVEGSGLYSYNWNTNDTIQAISNLCAGSYAVTVVDKYGCSASAAGNVSKPSVITINTSASDDTCADCNNASAIVTGNGGTRPYTYAWDNGQTTQSVTGLAPGIYHVCIMDANGCQACDSVVISLHATGIMQVDGETAISIYPNPNNGYFSINTNGINGNVMVELFSINGEKIFTENYANINNHSFDLSQYAKGIYIIQLTSVKGVVRGKIITQ